MLESRHLLMLSVEGIEWTAAEWPPIGRAFTREQAEAVAVQGADRARFLLPLRGDTKRFERGEQLVMAPGETLWDYGEPLRMDLRAVLRAAAAAPSPEPLPAPSAGRLPVRIATVREIAASWLGVAPAHVLEVAFDELIFDLGGRRLDAEPAIYLVPFPALDPH